MIRPSIAQIKDLTDYFKSQKVKTFKGLGIELEFDTQDYSAMIPENTQESAITEEQLRFFSSDPDVLARS
jgi:hypothetical protein|tara:strand:+ start:332 stop:541 length:210 start_codon:yes stop_codon:yes gene_type:complete